MRVLLLAALLVGCAEPLPGEAVPRSDPLYAQIVIVAIRWSDEPQLELPRQPCGRWLREVEIRKLGGDEWRSARHSAALVFAGSRPVIYLAPWPTADGYEAGVRHEIAHMLAACSGMDRDVYGHETAAIWSSSGVVWGGT